LTVLATLTRSNVYPSAGARTTASVPMLVPAPGLIAQWLSDRLGQQFIVENRSRSALVEALRSALEGGATSLPATYTTWLRWAVSWHLHQNLSRDVTTVRFTQGRNCRVKSRAFLISWGGRPAWLDFSSSSEFSP
jgi:hypothetical protein